MHQKSILVHQMTIQELERVCWRITENHPEITQNPQKTHHISKKELRIAIIKEIGTDERTIKNAIKKLKEIGWLKGIKSAIHITPEGIQHSA